MTDKKLVYLIGDFSSASVKVKNMLGFARRIDTQNFGDGHMHPVDVGNARFIFRAADDVLLAEKKGKPDVFVFPDTARQTFILGRDGGIDVVPP